MARASNSKPGKRSPGQGHDDCRHRPPRPPRRHPGGERRKPPTPLLLGFGALPVRGLLLPMAVADPAMLVAVQALDGVSAAALGVMLPLVAADLTHGTNRFNTCMGVFGLATGVGATLSTAAAGAIAGWLGTGPAFIALAMAGLLAVLLVLFAMPETLEPAGRPGTVEYARGEW